MRSASTPVYITIRDNRAPVFTSPMYNASLDERLQVNELVVTVTANDPDGDSVTYSIKVRVISSPDIA